MLRDMARVLLIDDTILARDLLKRFLTTAGYEVVGEAADGREGLEKFEALMPDLVILDMIMPVMAGTDTIQGIIALSPSANVLVVSADGKKDHVEGAIRAGAKGYIVKPYRREMVLAEVGKILGTGTTAGPPRTS
jgi:two-component system chemotaxis response regulator CheY